MGKEKAGAWGLSLLMAATPVGAVANEVTVNPLIVPETINIKGEMASQQEIVLTDQKEIQTNQRFGEFLNGEGEYSDEKLKDKMFYSYLESESGLGLCGVTKDNKILVVQGVLLDHFESGDKNFVMTGVKNRKGERGIALSQWLVDEMIETYSRVPVLSVNRKEGSVEHKANNYKTESDLLSFLDSELLNKVVLIDYYNYDSSMLKNNDEKIRDYFNEYVFSKRETNSSFVSTLLQQSDSKRFGLENVKLSDSPRIDKNIWVTTYADVRKQVADNSNDFPLMASFEYSIGK